MAAGRGESLSEKLGIGEGMTVGILNAPNYFDYDLGDLPTGVTVHRDSFEQPADLFLIFAARPDEAERGFQRALTVLPPDGAVWIAWETDPPAGDDALDEEALREIFSDTGMVAEEKVVLDDTWQGLRFVVPGENRDQWGKITPEAPITE